MSRSPRSTPTFAGAWQDFVLELCREFRISVVFITHDVEEAIVLGERLIVMGSPPGRILGEFDVSRVAPCGDDIIYDPTYREHRHEAVRLLGDGLV